MSTFLVALKKMFKKSIFCAICKIPIFDKGGNRDIQKSFSNLRSKSRKAKKDKNVAEIVQHDKKNICRISTDTFVQNF